MPTIVPALATDSLAAQFHRTTVERRDLAADDVAIDIAYAGICHSDIHTARGEWGPVAYPLVPGHEIAGTVSAVGSAVTKFRVGDRVGVGCFVDSCGECANCRSGQEMFCTSPEHSTVWTYNGMGRDGKPTMGGYSTSIVVRQDYVLRIPDALGLDVAAPLLCAGITTYSPLKRWGAGPGKKVAIVGMGGLGHMAVQIAHAMGAEVTVLSRTLSKQADGIRFGASRYYATSDPATFPALAGHFDLILSTVSADLDIDSYLDLLAINGAMVFVGMPPEAQNVHLNMLERYNRAIAGSNIGGIPETQEMLDFCAEHDLGSIVEVIGADEVTAAYDKVVAGQVRYRYVIDVSTIPA